MATYNVYRNDEKIATGLNSKEYKDTGLSPNTEYNYQVSSENALGESEKSDVLTVKTDFSKATGVTVEPTSKEIEVGGTVKLVAKVQPDTAKQEVTYSVDDGSVVTVTGDGVVTGVGEGVQEVVVTAEGKTAKATITVKKPVVKVTGVELTPKSMTGEAGKGETRQLTVKVLPENATDKGVTYKVEPATEGLTVNGSNVLAWTDGVADGSYSVVVTTKDGGKTATSTLVLTAPEPEPEPDPEPEPEEGE